MRPYSAAAFTGGEPVGSQDPSGAPRCQEGAVLPRCRRDGRARRDGRFIEIVGRYNPRTTPSVVELDLEKIDAWIAKGAQPTEAAGKLIAIARGEKEAPVEAEAALQEGRRPRLPHEAEAAEKAAADAAAKAAEGRGRRPPLRPQKPPRPPRPKSSLLRSRRGRRAEVAEEAAEEAADAEAAE